jgi:hypothetical protein
LIEGDGSWCGVFITPHLKLAVLVRAAAFHLRLRHHHLAETALGAALPA